MKKTKLQDSWMFILSASLGICLGGLAGCGEFDDLLPGLTQGGSGGEFPGSGQGSGEIGSGSHADVTGTHDAGNDGSGTQGSPQHRYAVLKNWDKPAQDTPIIRGEVRFSGLSAGGRTRAMVWLDECRIGHYEVEIRTGERCGATPKDNLERWDPTGFGVHTHPGGLVEHAGVIGVVGCQSSRYSSLLERTSTHWRLDEGRGDPIHRTVVLRDPNTGLDIACGEVQAGLK